MTDEAAEALFTSHDGQLGAERGKRKKTHADEALEESAAEEDAILEAADAEAEATLEDAAEAAEEAIHRRQAEISSARKEDGKTRTAHQPRSLQLQ